jgi:protein-disulfide isomerase
MKLQHPTAPGGSRLAARLRRRALAPLVLALATGCAGGESDADPPAEDASTESLTRSLVTTPPETLPGEQIDFPGLGYDFGDPEATLRIAELSDFGCGFCRQFHQQTFPVLQEEYIDAGTVLWKYIPIVTGMFPHGDLSALAGECAGEQDDFEGMMVRLFEDQRTWKDSGDPMPHFMGYAAELGLNSEQFESCIAEERPGRRIADGGRAARALGLRGTPSFLINGFPVQGALPTQLFRDILDNELAALAEAAESGN